jgi:undecaprenyl-diphosphatase
MFADIPYWIGLTVGFLIVYPLLTRADKEKTRWVLSSLLPAVFLSYLLSFSLKLLFRVERPCALLEICPSGYSLPSGHSAVIAAFAAVTVLNMGKNRLYLLTIPLAFLVGLSRIFLNFHTPIDVISGALIGTFCGYLVQFLNKRAKLT